MYRKNFRWGQFRLINWNHPHLVYINCFIATSTWSFTGQVLCPIGYSQSQLLSTGKSTTNLKKNYCQAHPKLQLQAAELSRELEIGQSKVYELTVSVAIRMLCLIFVVLSFVHSESSIFKIFSMLSYLSCSQ